MLGSIAGRIQHASGRVDRLLLEEPFNRREARGFVSGFSAGYLEARPSNEPARAQIRSSCLAQFENPTPQQSADCADRATRAQTEEYKRWDSLDPLPPGTFGETIEATDKFFEEIENRVMPIVAAWIITKWRREGKK